MTATTNTPHVKKPNLYYSSSNYYLQDLLHFADDGAMHTAKPVQVDLVERQLVVVGVAALI